MNPVHFSRMYLSALSGLLLISASAWGVEPIIRPFLSTRSVGMGGVVMTTGLYEENFFNNPARVTANPTSKLTVLDVTLQTNQNTLQAAPHLSGTLEKIINQEIGKNLHVRSQFVLPAWYLATNDNRRLALGIGIITGAEANIAISNNYHSSGSIIADFGPAITVGYKLLPDESLSVGMTLHGTYRFSNNDNLSLLDLIQGSRGNFGSLSNAGAMYNVNLGVTYQFLQLGAWEFNAAVAGQNLLGGAFNFNPIKIAQVSPSPIPQPRSFGFGLSVSRREWWALKNSVFALELSDLNNNGSGSIYRLLHAGMETQWQFLSLRGGLNQGYWTAGLGIQLPVLSLNFASYGEELGLNAGQQEDRRYVANLRIQF